MSTALIIITALSYGYVLGRLHERIEAASYGARCERDSLGWWIRKPEFRELYHPDQDAIEADPPMNIWTVQRMPCWYEMTMRYERWRAPRSAYND
jgi:hypothetical protein